MTLESIKIKCKNLTWDYDYLILASGLVNNYFGNNDWGKYTTSLKNLDDALSIRNQVLKKFEDAEWIKKQSDLEKKMKFVIIGAGAMGSSFLLYHVLDNNHDINIVGTHLENNFIDQLKNNENLHPGLNTKIPQEIKIFKFEKFEELLNSKVDLIVLGISSKGIEWVSDQLSKLYND